jgi:hypothetical protein
MARITLANLKSIGDIIPSDSFELLFGTIPTRGANKSLTLKCLTVSMPGFNTEFFTVRLHGQTPLNFRGAKLYGSQDITVSFVEDSTMDTYNTLCQWHEYIVGSDSGASSGSHADYSVDSDLVIYNQQAVEINRLTLHGMFIHNVAETQLTGEQTTAMQIQATFKFDYFTGTGFTTK